MTLDEIQIKFYNFQDTFTKDSNDKSQIKSINTKLAELNDKIKIQFQIKQFGNQKGLLENLPEQLNQKNRSKEIKLSYLINPFKVEYINKVTQLFNQKLNEINKSSFMEVLLWQLHYYHSFSQQNQEQLLQTIFNCMDMTIKIYRETQSRLENKLVQETKLFNQFYQSLFRQSPEYKLEIEELYLKSKEDLNIYLENEFFMLIKDKFPDLVKRDLKSFADDISRNLWMKAQIKLQEEYFKLALDSILNTIKRFDDI
ncbi:unnamed protein product (macronuclear) [Paramecium tetraurelia]|uniref:Uncharacterized protein n=1 Tax=Paramecium tetraurelia TaxID=5888 RepID=A0CDW9_PARTE|nr:uncharacterized protein GSPATT00007198001 [Paramecium tetraurelia]CAK68986.1 unnamed protein product [Paramecium tetraurelia]|eukprot:XP_001436383.1 hypothetical protein (macronuclear) [Paramecium tetraurelia strain d4-2]